MSNSMSHYAAAYRDADFFSVLKAFARKLGSKVVHEALCLWIVMQEDKAPAWARAVALGALGYLISPLDGVPDVIPMVGLADDAAVIAAAMITLRAYVTEEIKRRAKEMLPEWMATAV